MVKTQVQIPNELYQEAKRVAQEREMSLAEVIRRGIEYMSRVYPPIESSEDWSPPKPHHLGGMLARPDKWRELANLPSSEASEK